MTKIALVGAGFVADYYMTTLANHPALSLAGVWDHDPERLKRFSDYHRIHAYGSAQECLDDPKVRIVVNLTNPESHFAINCAALEAGKHVYCEKPLGMSYEQAREVIAARRAPQGPDRLRRAGQRAVRRASSWSSGLIAEAGSIGHATTGLRRDGGRPGVQGQLGHGWRSRSGAKWPGLHEFEVGCTLEHAGYGLSWLVALFGPVEQAGRPSPRSPFPTRGRAPRASRWLPDFSVGCLTFRSGVTARLTCGLAAPRDRSLTIVGDAGFDRGARLCGTTARRCISAASTSKRPLLQRLAGRFERGRGRVSAVAADPGPVLSPIQPAASGDPACLVSLADRFRPRNRSHGGCRCNSGQVPFFSGRSGPASTRTGAGAERAAAGHVRAALSDSSGFGNCFPGRPRSRSAVVSGHGWRFGQHAIDDPQRRRSLSSSGVVRLLAVKPWLMALDAASISNCRPEPSKTVHDACARRGSGKGG
jgi:hypothetical protein